MIFSLYSYIVFEASFISLSMVSFNSLNILKIVPSCFCLWYPVFGFHQGLFMSVIFHENRPYFLSLLMSYNFLLNSKHFEYYNVVTLKIRISSSLWFSVVDSWGEQLSFLFTDFSKLCLQRLFDVMCGRWSLFYFSSQLRRLTDFLKHLMPKEKEKQYSPHLCSLNLS